MNQRNGSPPADDAQSKGHRATALVWIVLLAAGLGVGLWSLQRVQLKPEQSTHEAWMDGHAETYRHHGGSDQGAHSGLRCPIHRPRHAG